jgi:hypothetical protein
MSALTSPSSEYRVKISILLDYTDASITLEERKTVPRNQGQSDHLDCPSIDISSRLLLLESTERSLLSNNKRDLVLGKVTN